MKIAVNSSPDFDYTVKPLFHANGMPVFSSINHIDDSKGVITIKKNDNFRNYLYPDELPNLGNKYLETSVSNDELNCHCYAINLDEGYDSPADAIATFMNKKEVLENIKKWFTRKGYNFVAKSFECPSLKRNIRKERVIVFGLSSLDARCLLGDNQKKISNDLKSTLATAMQYSNDAIYPTHSIRQNIKGDWESKMGSGPVITISDPTLLAGGVYGTPYLVFEKDRLFS